MMPVYTHHVPGRLRVRITAFKRNEPLAEALRTALLAIDGVKSVSASTVTGSVVILYDPDGLDPAVLWHAIRRIGGIDHESPAAAPTEPGVAEQLALAAAGHLARVALEHVLRQLVGHPAAALIGALI